MRGLEGGKRLLEPGLDNLKALVRWRGDDVEASECEKTGVGLLFWAAVSNNAMAVRELGSDAIITSFRTTEAVGGAMTMHRPDLFSCFYKGSTALHVGMLFSGWELVEELLDLGIDPYSKSILGIDALMSAACTPDFSFDGPAQGKAKIVSRAGDATKSKITEFCARFPNWDMERKAARAGGSTALGFAVLLGPDKQDSVKALLAAGADPLYVIDTGATILHQTASNIDAGASLVELIVGIRGVRLMIDKPIRAQTMKWKVTYFITWGRKGEGRSGRRGRGRGLKGRRDDRASCSSGIRSGHRISHRTWSDRTNSGMQRKVQGLTISLRTTLACGGRLTGGLWQTRWAATIDLSACLCGAMSAAVEAEGRMRAAVDDGR